MTIPLRDEHFSLGYQIAFLENMRKEEKKKARIVLQYLPEISMSHLTSSLKKVEDNYNKVKRTFKRKSSIDKICINIEMNQDYVPKIKMFKSLIDLKNRLEDNLEPNKKTINSYLKNLDFDVIRKLTNLEYNSKKKQYTYL